MDKPTDIDFKSLKALLTKSEEEDVVDMLSSYTKINKEEIGIMHAIRMDVNLVDRLDKICIRYYGTIDYLDLLLAYNDIVNPFDIPYGAILFIPDKNNLLDGTKHPVIDKVIRKMNTSFGTIQTKNDDNSQIVSSLSSNFAKKKSGMRSSLVNRGNGMKYDGKKVVF